MNFWSTLEVYCICAGLGYEQDYLDFHKRADHSYKPLCQEAYDALAKVIELQMEHDFKE